VLEDIVFSLAKNHENFSFEKLSGLFPALSVDFIKKRFLLAKENLSLLDEIVSDTLESAQNSNNLRVSEEKSPGPEKISEKPLKSRESRILPLSSDPPIVTIHVLDEARDLKEDFHCGRELLVSEMKYFKEYLPEEESALNEIDISVHCDVDIFGWLMKWVKRFETAEDFTFLQSNVVPVLVSADFLQMVELVEYAAKETVKFISKVNLKVLSKGLIEKVANHMQVKEAECVIDENVREDVYKRLTINLVMKARLFKCSICSNILPWRERQNLRCSGKSAEIDKKGNVKWKHQVETEWDFVNGNNSELLKLVAEHKSYKLIYWKLWGLINVYKCPKCDQYFQACDLKSCLYHPKEAVSGYYGCCRRPKQHLNALLKQNGCQRKNHVIKDTSIEPYLEFCEITRDLDNESAIGPMWKKSSIKNVPSLWQSGKSLRWNLDNIRDEERRLFRLDSDSCAFGTVTSVPPAGIYAQLERERMPRLMRSKK